MITYIIFKERITISIKIKIKKRERITIAYQKSFVICSTRYLCWKRIVTLVYYAVIFLEPFSVSVIQLTKDGKEANIKGEL